MKTYGLSGRSGTGKSYNAIELCSRLGVPALIDDGLFVYENSVVAGTSAKKQRTKVGAIKTALFAHDDHCTLVQESIIKIKPEAILVLGTSDRMIDLICKRLNLPAPTQYIHIEDVISEEQIEKASELRQKAGMHTIPAPTFQLRRQFSGYFLDAKKSFRKRGNTQQDDGEKTIVRPTYSYMGSYEVSDKVISDIAEHVINTTPGAAGLIWCATVKEDDGIYIRVICLVEWGTRVRAVAKAVQKSICDAVESMTAFNILGAEVEVRGYKVKNS